MFEISDGGKMKDIPGGRDRRLSGSAVRVQSGSQAHWEPQMDVHCWGKQVVPVQRAEPPTILAIRVLSRLCKVSRLS
jgi:hypothetical protein